MKSGAFAVFTGVLIALGALLPQAYAGNAKIGGYLDANGIEYRVISAESWRLASEKLDEMLNDMVWSSDLSNAKQRNVLRLVTLFRLFRDVSGLDHAEGTGSSSSRLDDNYIHNRVFLALDPDSPGVVNGLLGQSNINAGKFLRQLPSGTLFAVSANIAPETLFSVLKQSGDWGKMITGHFPIAQSLPELFRQSRGEWQLIVARHNGKLIWQLSVPDKDGRWFALAMIVGKKGKGFSTSKAVMPIELDNEFPVVIKKNAAINIFSSSAAEKYFAEASLMKLADKWESAILKRMPENGTAVIFANFGDDDLGKNEICGLQFRPLSGIPSLGVLSREKDGWLYTENSDTTMFVGDALGMIFSVPRCMEFISSLLEAEDEENAVKSEAEVPAIQNDDCACRDLLSAADKLLKRKPEAPGFYTVLSRKSNAKRLKACKKGEHQLVCFSKLESSKPVPVAVCATHGDKFCVLFSDGKIKCFELKELGGYRRIIGYLQTQYMYDEKVFGRLMQEAAGFDSK